MYGMVNRSFEQYFRDLGGDEAWAEVRRRAQIVDETFVTMAQYPDELSVAILLAGADFLGVEPTVLLERLGEHWLVFAEHAGYGAMMRTTGDTIPGFLQNLDELHARLSLTFPHLQPPRFWCTEVEPATLLVHYSSTRHGLAPFAAGLLRGVGRMFGRVVDVTHVQVRSAEQDHDVFRLDIGQALEPAVP